MADIAREAPKLRQCFVCHAARFPADQALFYGPDDNNTPVTLCHGTFDPSPTCYERYVAKQAGARPRRVKGRRVGAAPLRLPRMSVGWLMVIAGTLFVALAAGWAALAWCLLR